MSACPLRGETVIVRHVSKGSDLFSGERHVLAGGMADTSFRRITVPLTSNGSFKPVLTEDEADYLEKVMCMQPGTLSAHKKTDNYWSSVNPAATVQLGKHDMTLNLADPVDFIKYKILLCNSDRIAPDVKTLEEHHKESYEYVLIKSEDEMDDKKSRMTNLMECYRIYGKIEEDADKLRCIIELINKRPLAAGTKLSWLQTTCNDIIQDQTKTFLRVATDPLLDMKVFIKKCVAVGLISNRGGMLYLRKDGQPMCGAGEEPTLNIAARWLSEPVHQELKLTLEATLNGNVD